jgi:pimeloyl-ACP methyl ester carboxylesterase
MADCTVTSKPPVTTAPALCGTLQGPEDRTNPTGRQISLRVAVVPAQADTPAADAFFALAGGPNEAATAFFGWLPGRFSEVHATRDIVLVDQRGTGGSNELVLPTIPDTSGESPSDAESRLRAWSDDWMATVRADPRQYTSTVAADDLDAVRQALGYDLVDLYGPSYGATLAQYYIRQHPEHVRVAIMDGGTPLDVPLFERMAASSQAALQLLLSRCAADGPCHAALPEVDAEWRTLVKGLETGIRTTVVDEDTGKPGVATLADSGPLIHEALLEPSRATRLPLAIHLASSGRWAEVAPVLSEPAGNDVVLAMSQVILCSEAWARFDPAEVRRHGQGSYLLPAKLGQAEERARLCSVLPRGVVPDDDAAPVVTDLPLLWLTGDGDPQDPPANLSAIPAQQPNARIAVMPAQQHTVSLSGCAPTVIAELVDAGTTKGLDTTCIERAEVPGLTFTLE